MSHNNQKDFPHYYKRLPDGTTHVDVYHVLRLFNVTDQAIGHAIKKLLCAGQRGTKQQEQDLQEAGNSIARALEILSAEHYNGMGTASGHQGYVSAEAQKLHLGYEVVEEGTAPAVVDPVVAWPSCEVLQPMPMPIVVDTAGAERVHAYVSGPGVDYNAVRDGYLIAANMINSALRGARMARDFSVRVESKAQALDILTQVDDGLAPRVVFYWFDDTKGDRGEWDSLRQPVPEPFAGRYDDF